MQMQTTYLPSLMINLTLMNPFLVFLVVNSYQTPHDCFTCFNRLPSKRYSSYQYTQEESNHNLEQKFGLGAVKKYEELIRLAEQEVEQERMLNQNIGRPRQATMVRTAEGKIDAELERQYRQEKVEMERIFNLMEQ